MFHFTVPIFIVRSYAPEFCHDSALTQKCELFTFARKLKISTSKLLIYHLTKIRLRIGSMLRSNHIFYYFLKVFFFKVFFMNFTNGKTWLLGSAIARLPGNSSPLGVISRDHINFCNSFIGSFSFSKILLWPRISKL